MHNRLNANAESVLYMHEKKVKHYPDAMKEMQFA